MRVIEPSQFKAVKQPKTKSTRLTSKLWILVLVLVGYALISILRPVEPLVASFQTVAPVTSPAVPLAWPTYGQAAVGAVGYGVLDTKGEQKPLPTASVAKVMTALAVLKQKPLQLGEQGPIITINQADIEEYTRTVANDGSNVPVALGEEITQYQALQALLLPSANNMAHTLARWAYGSEKNFLQFVNNFAKSLGMQNSNFDDTSGLSAKTVSTSQDLVRLAVNAMDNPVIAEIAAQKRAEIPVAGQIYNVNSLLGRNSIIGVKTGNTEEAGGCFMAAAVREINGHKVVAVSVIMGAPNLSTALRDSIPLVTSVLDNFEYRTVAKAGEPIGAYQVPWGGTVPIAVKQDVGGIAWKATPLLPTTQAERLAPSSRAGTKAGSLTANFGRDTATTELITTSAANKPPLHWRFIPRF
jgi:D-alanyl-D-alanine carboxypeptidase (penicillin-binding protein 5/6)